MVKKKVNAKGDFSFEIMPIGGDVSKKFIQFKKNSGVSRYYNYGWDLGKSPWGYSTPHGGFSSNRKSLHQSFAYYASMGVKTVRLLMFADFRTGLVYDEQKNLVGFDKMVFPDTDALIEIAKQYQLQIIPVLLDYHIANGETVGEKRMLGEHPEFFTSKKEQLLPLLRQWLEHLDAIAGDTVQIIDCINEPELIQSEFVSHQEVKELITDVVHLIHKNTSFKATVGSVNSGSMYAWVDTGIDVLQYHYYDTMESSFPLSTSFDTDDLTLPILVGELQPSDVHNKLAVVYGIPNTIGALFWHDNSYDFNAVAIDFKTWFESNK